MDHGGKRTSTRATLLAAAGQNCWPPAGSYMAAAGQDLMAADRRARLAVQGTRPSSATVTEIGSLVRPRQSLVLERRD